MSEALIVVQLLNAVLVAGGNMTIALQRMSTLLRQKHDAGETLQMADLNKLFDEGDALEAAVLAKAQAALDVKPAPE